MSVRSLLVLTFMTLLLGAAPLQAQDHGDTNALDEALQELSDKIMRVHITARVTSDGEETVWNMDLTRVTISGRAVTVRLDGSNITVVTQFTPYYDSDDSLLLVAQGQTWIADNDGNSRVNYQTSFKSMPMELGETVVFLPLGTDELKMDLDREESDMFNLELEVTIVPYENDSAPSSESDSMNDASNTNSE